MIGERATKAQARALFHLPDSHTSEYLEQRGRNSEVLRSAIRAAEKTFNLVCDRELKKLRASRPARMEKKANA